MSETEIKLRQQIRASAVGLVPAQHIDEVVDLAFHAFNKSFAAIGPITASASNSGVAMCATGVALSLIAAEAKAKLDSLRAVTEAFGGRVEIVSAGGANG